MLVSPRKGGSPESEEEGRGYGMGEGAGPWPSKALGVGEGRKPGCRKGLFTERSGENGWKGRVGSKSHSLECYVKELDFTL